VTTDHLSADSDELTPVEPDEEEFLDADGVEDFDGFWARQHAQRAGGASTRARARVRGVIVTAPLDIPIAFELRSRQVQKSKDPDEVKALIALLTGPEVLERLIDAGIGGDELQVVLAWACANAGHRKRVSFGEVARRVAEAEAAGRGPGKPKRKTKRKRGSGR